jgi:hypothetical protein
MEDGKGHDHIERGSSRHLLFPCFRPREIGLQKERPISGRLASRFRQHGRAEIQPQVSASMPETGQLTRQLSPAASQVEKAIGQLPSSE